MHQNDNPRSARSLAAVWSGYLAPYTEEYRKPQGPTPATGGPPPVVAREVGLSKNLDGEASPPYSHREFCCWVRQPNRLLDQKPHLDHVPPTLVRSAVLRSPRSLPGRMAVGVAGLGELAAPSPKMTRLSKSIRTSSCN